MDKSLNFGASLLVLLFSVVAFNRLEKRLKADARFLLPALACWCVAWFVWTILWGHAWYYPVGGEEWSILMSDVNTIFFLLFYFGLTRGTALRAAAYFSTGIVLAVSVLIAYVALHALPGGELGETLHQRWSMFLSMAGPLIVGWAF